MKVGFVGLGAMGAGIVPRLMAGGHTVTGWNRTRAKAEPLITQGMRWAEERRAYWDDGSAVAVHNWWHASLFQLALGRRAGALACCCWNAGSINARAFTMAPIRAR